LNGRSETRRAADSSTTAGARCQAQCAQDKNETNVRNPKPRRQSGSEVALKRTRDVLHEVAVTPGVTPRCGGPRETQRAHVAQSRVRCTPAYPVRVKLLVFGCRSCGSQRRARQPRPRDRLGYLRARRRASPVTHAHNAVPAPVTAHVLVKLITSRVLLAPTLAASTTVPVGPMPLTAPRHSSCHTNKHCSCKHRQKTQSQRVALQLTHPRDPCP
jgi:hypothetical protein